MDITFKRIRFQGFFFILVLELFCLLPADIQQIQEQEQIRIFRFTIFGVKLPNFWNIRVNILSLHGIKLIKL